MSKEKSNQQISNSEEAITTQPVNSNPQITSSPTSIDVPTSEGCYDAECDNVCTFLECICDVCQIIFECMSACE